MQFFATIAKKAMNKSPDQCLSLCIKSPNIMLQVQKFLDRAEHLQSHTQAGGFKLNQKMKPGVAHSWATAPVVITSEHTPIKVFTVTS